MEKLLYSMDEAAELLGISRGTIYNQSHAINSVKIGRRRFISADEIQRLAREGTQPPWDKRYARNHAS